MQASKKSETDGRRLQRQRWETVRHFSTHRRGLQDERFNRIFGVAVDITTLWPSNLCGADKDRPGGCLKCELNNMSNEEESHTYTHKKRAPVRVIAKLCDVGWKIPFDCKNFHAISANRPVGKSTPHEMKNCLTCLAHLRAMNSRLIPCYDLNSPTCLYITFAAISAEQITCDISKGSPLPGLSCPLCAENSFPMAINIINTSHHKRSDARSITPQHKSLTTQKRVARLCVHDHEHDFRTARNSPSRAALRALHSCCAARNSSN